MDRQPPENDEGRPGRERQRVCEPSEHAGHSPVLVGWIETSDEGSAPKQAAARCASCGNTVATAIGERADRNAEAELRAHHHQCRHRGAARATRPPQDKTC